MPYVNACTRTHTRTYAHMHTIKLIGDHFVTVSAGSKVSSVSNLPGLGDIALHCMNYASQEEVSERIKLQPPNSVIGQEPALFQPAFQHEVDHSWSETTCRWFSGQQITQDCSVHPSATRRESPTPAAGG